MASTKRKFTAEEVLEEVFKEEEEKEGDQEDSIESQEERLKAWIQSFNGGERLDLDFFRENAIEVIRPVFRHSLMVDENDTKGMSVFFQCALCRTIILKVSEQIAKSLSKENFKKSNNLKYSTNT